MTRAAAALLILISTLVATAVGLAMGPVEGVCVGLILGSAACACALRLSTRMVRRGQPYARSQGAGAATADWPASELQAPQAPPAADTPQAKAPDTPSAKDDAPKDAAIEEGGSQASHAQQEDARDVGDARQARFSYERFRTELLLSDNPLDALAQRVGRIRTSEQDGKESPSQAELFLARQLEEAGLEALREEKDLTVQVVQPARSGLFYLRSNAKSLTFGTYLRLLRTEAALNALQLAADYYDDLESTCEADLYRLAQRTTTSVCAQADDVDTADWSYLAMPWQAPFGPAQHGEWSVRQSLSESIESARVPYRLEVRFRANVAAGDVAMELITTPARAFPASAYVSGLGIVSTTAQMRGRESSKYAARLGLLLANYAFHASERVRRVWIAAISETPSRRACLFSGRIDRRPFSRIRMSAVSDPLSTLRLLGMELEEENGILIPSEQVFYLEDERFCPKMRHDLWNLSERPLPASAALSLGATRVSGLSIYEELPRTLAAESLLRTLPNPQAPSVTQDTVRHLMEVAHTTSDLTVWSAMERAANKIVSGTLEPENIDALHDEIVSGDELTRTMAKAHDLVVGHHPRKALRLLRSMLSSVDKGGAYQDTDAVVYRCFGSFTERVIYNRHHAHDTRTVVLVPDAYLAAHLTASGLLASLPQELGGNAQQALYHAERALAVAPLNDVAHLGVVGCLEQLGQSDEAKDQLVSYLKVAYNPQGIGFAYYRLAALLWQQGELDACQASYQRCVRVLPDMLPVVMAQCQALAEQGATFSSIMGPQEVDAALEKRGIPLAPTNQTSFYLYDGATASVDAEVFPVARDIMGVIEALTGDDVMRGIRNSLEREPDA